MTRITQPIRPMNKIRSGGGDGTNFYQTTFLLTQDNVSAFIRFCLEEGFKGKFVFNRTGQRLGMASFDADKNHSEIIGNTIKTVAELDRKDNFVCAKILFNAGKGYLSFDFEGDSGIYGAPKRNKMREAALYLATILSRAGLSPVSISPIKGPKDNEYRVSLRECLLTGG